METVTEIFQRMKSKAMIDKAPSKDGIPYTVYGKLWVQAGKLILKAWKYSNKKGVLSREQLPSIIMLLEKKGKSNTV